MAYEETHVAGETISSADIDRHLTLVEQGVLLQQSGIKLSLKDQITINELEPDLRAAILQALLSSHALLSENFTGDGITTVFVLSAAPTIGAEAIHLNGMLQKNGVDYTISGVNLTFLNIPDIGDWISVVYASSSGPTVVHLGNFILNHRNIREMMYYDSHIYTYGINKSTGLSNVAKYEYVNVTQTGSNISVATNTAHHGILTLAIVGGTAYMWAVGSTSSGHSITKIKCSDLTSTVIQVTVDTAATISALTTDGVYVYAFINGGTVSPNVVAKIDCATNVITGFAAAPSSISSTGNIDMIIGPDGFLYISFDNINATNRGQVRKYDLGTGSETVFTFVESPPNPLAARPIRLANLPSSVVVLDNLRNKIYNISAGSAVTVFLALGYTPTDMQTNGTDVWVSTGDKVYKINNIGTMIDVVIPQTGLNIQHVMSGGTLVWTSFSNDAGAADSNMTKIFPGL